MGGKIILIDIDDVEKHRLGRIKNKYTPFYNGRRTKIKLNM